MEIQTIQPFLHYWGNVRERTMRVARCIPPDKIDWTYADGKFTLGDILRHLAVAERYMWAENVQCRPLATRLTAKHSPTATKTSWLSLNDCTANRWKYLASSPTKTFSANAKLPPMRPSPSGN